MSSTISTENCLPQGTILIGGTYQYRIVRVIGNGTFGITYLAEIFDSKGYNTHQLAAVKELFMRDCNSRDLDGHTVIVDCYDDLFHNYFRRFKREVENIRLIQRESELNVVSVIDCFEQNGTIYYSMTYISGGTLNDRIGREGYLSEQTALRIASITAKTLGVLHTRGMLHLDIKPANIMLLGGETPMLIDFGLAKHFGIDGAPEGTAVIGSGTPGYAPLEQSSYRPGISVPYTIDIYSLGATIFKMLTGKRPPDASDIFNDHFPAEELEAKGVSNAVVRIVRRAMMPDCSSRYPNMAVFSADMDYVITCISDGSVAGILPSEVETETLNGFYGDPYVNPFGYVSDGVSDLTLSNCQSYDSPEHTTGFETIDGVKRTPDNSSYSNNQHFDTLPVLDGEPDNQIDNEYEKELSREKKLKIIQTISAAAVILILLCGGLWVYNGKNNTVTDVDEIEGMYNSDAFIEVSSTDRYATNVSSASPKKQINQTKDIASEKYKAFSKQRQYYKAKETENDSIVNRWNKTR